MSKTVIALFDHMGQAQDAADALRTSGFADDRIEVLIGREFLRRGELPPPAHERRMWDGVKRFFDEIGMTTPPPPAEGAYQPVEPDDGVVLLETGDERAETAASVLDRAGAVSIEERSRRRGQRMPPHRATGLEPQTSGRTPPELKPELNREPGDVDERSLAGAGRSGNTRIYAASE